MTLPELSIRRHALAFMMSAVLVLFGLISTQRLGVDRFPTIEFPFISVTTLQPGANPEIVDASITNLVETTVNSVPGIKHIQSVSSPGVSGVFVTFELDKDIDVAFNEVQARVNQMLTRLPEDAEPPVVAKIQTNTQPILWLALSGDRTPQQLNLYAANVIKKRLETVNGVGEVRLGGQRERVIRVNLNPESMAAFKVAPADVVNAFRQEHVQLPGGFLVGGRTEYLIKADLEFHSLASLENLIVAYRAGAPIRLKNIATVRDDLEDYRQLARINGQPTVGVGIVKVANANTVAIVAEVLRRLETEIRPQLPPGMRIEVASNDAVYIQEMVDSLEQHLLEGTLLAALVVLLFLKSLRSTLIIAVAIPVSLLGSIAVMYFAGFTFNSLTLLALLLLIGVVVDDAIVVLENIYRHREHLDPDPVSAAVNGSREVVFAVIAASLSLVAIFVPVIFLGGIIGQFFKSFAVVVTMGVLVSLFVSLTLTPMLCARYLKVSREHGPVYRRLEGFFRGMDRFYVRSLRAALARRGWVVAATVLVVLASGVFFAAVGKEFVPEEDEGRFLVYVKTPLGTNIEYAAAKLTAVEAVMAKEPSIATYFTAIGLGQAGQVNQAVAFVTMKERGARDISQAQLIARLRERFAAIPGVEAFPSQVPIIGGVRGEPLQFVVAGPSLTEVGRLSQALQTQLSSIPGMGRVDMDLQLDLPQLELRVDRERAESLGLSARDLAVAVNVLAGGLDVARFNEQPGDGERYAIRLKARERAFEHPEDLKQIYLRSRQDDLVRLDTVASFERSLGPAVISRYDLRYAANFFGAPTLPLGEAVDVVMRTAEPLLPPGYAVRVVGQAEEFGNTVKYMTFAFAMALILLYMVLASQFNSFLQPFIIMLAQPLAIIGGVAALWLTGHTLNIYSMIGLVLLIGLVAKNSILLVDLTNQRRAQGLAVDAALLDACPIRLRPVLMTSLTVILALLPAALGLGAGAATNGPLAVAVIGGMVSSTLLTLVVVPAVYSLVENRRGRRRGGKTPKGGAPAPRPAAPRRES